MRYLTLALLLAIATGLQAASQLKIIQLQHRTAEEIIPLIRPMVSADTQLSGKAYKLIVRSPPEGFKELEGLLQQLDSAPAQLLISVRQGGVRLDSRQGGSVSGQYERGSGKVIVSDGTKGDREGLQVESSGKHLQGRVNVYQTDDRDDANVNQRLRVTEGQWATIQTGQAVPIVQQQMLQGPGGVVIQQGTQYQQVNTGFQVRPLVRGGRVSLEIRPQNNRLSRQGKGIIETQSLITTISGRLGEWIELGGYREDNQSKQGGRVHSTKSSKQRSESIHLKVEQLSNH